MTQPQATEVENVNPFNVIVFMGGIILDPPSDNWVRTIYTEENRQESSGAKWVEVATDTPTGPIFESPVEDQIYLQEKIYKTLILIITEEEYAL